MTKLSILIAAAFAVASVAASTHAEDSARKICMADAKRLCPDAVKAASRHRAEVCLAQRIAETTPACHDVVAKAMAARAQSVPGAR